MKPTVAIIGVGLIGGSLGQALRRTRRYRVLGIGRHARTLREAKRRGAIDVASTRLSDVASADIVVIASPVDTIVPLFKRMLPFLRPGTLVTDVGSVKQPILNAVARLRRPASIYFVGGHPLAGSHKAGVEAAHSRLFEGSTVVLTPGPPAAMKRLKSLWRAVGANPIQMSAQEHDRHVALSSHLPHAIAHTLVHLIVGSRRRNHLMPLLAGSFRDATRVASSDPEQWAQIFRANAGPIVDALAEFRRELKRLEKALPHPRLKTHLKKSQSFRRPLFNGI